MWRRRHWTSGSKSHINYELPCSLGFECISLISLLQQHVSFHLFWGCWSQWINPWIWRYWTRRYYNYFLGHFRSCQYWLDSAEKEMQNIGPVDIQACWYCRRELYRQLVRRGLWIQQVFWWPFYLSHRAERQKTGKGCEFGDAVLKGSLKTVDKVDLKVGKCLRESTTSILSALRVWC